MRGGWVIDGMLDIISRFVEVIARAIERAFLGELHFVAIAHEKVSVTLAAGFAGAAMIEFGRVHDG